MSAVKDHLRIMVVNDPHMSDVPPESRRDVFPDTPLGKVSQVVDFARKYQPDLTIFTGDHFHFKSAERTKYRTTREYAQLLKQIPGQRRTIVGNHDVPYDKPDRWVGQPLAYLIDSGALSYLGGSMEKSEEVFEKDGVKVRVKGINYYKGQGLEDLHQQKKGSEDYFVLVTHMDLFPRGVLSYEGSGIVHYEDVIHSPADFILNGHVHDDLGIRKIADTTIVNVGNLLRGSISESDLTRTPKVAFLFLTKDKADMKTAEVPLKVKPPAEVFEVVKNAIRKEREAEMKVFQTLFGETEGAAQTFDLEKELKQMRLEPSVRRKVDGFIDSARVLSRS